MGIFCELSRNYDITISMKDAPGNATKLPCWEQTIQETTQPQTIVNPPGRGGGKSHYSLNGFLRPLGGQRVVEVNFTGQEVDAPLTQ